MIMYIVLIGIMIISILSVTYSSNDDNKVVRTTLILADSLVILIAIFLIFEIIPDWMDLLDTLLTIVLGFSVLLSLLRFRKKKNS